MLNSINPQIIPDTKILISKLSPIQRAAAKGLKVYENDNHFSEVRFTQDLIVNWIPKIPFVRSLADFSEMSFLEISENILVYYGGKFLNNQIFKRIFLRKANPELVKNMNKSAVELMNDKNSKEARNAISKKATLAVCGLAIPLAEYALSYVKNLFTLKVFNQADFNNIANLNKDKNENIKNQNKVKESAKKHIKLAGIIFAGCLGFAALLSKKGRDVKLLQSISELILAPGSKLFKNSSNKERLVNKYFGLDSSKLTRGQLVTCVLAAFIGYCGAAKDRGKQNLLEVLYRFPLVGFYVVTGSEMLEAGYKKLLLKKGKCKEILEEANRRKDKEMPKFEEFSKIAYNLSVKNGTSVETEFKKLFAQKLAVIGVPLLFSLIVMGFFVAGCSKYFTQCRYNKEHEGKSNSKL